ncbi:MAG: HEAT repeat domain-containing protein [Actinomycetota bacterium]
MGAVGRFLRIRRGEGRTVGLIVALMFVAFAGSTVGESGVSALFFDRVGADALPLMYLAQGTIGLVTVLGLTGALGRFERRRAFVSMPLLIVAIVLGERVVLAADPGWIYPVLWLTVTPALLLQTVCLWGAAGLVTDTRRAKRLFPLFASGGILGSVVGGLTTRPLATAIGAEDLLLVWAASLAGAAMLCAAVLGLRRTGRRRPRLRRRPEPALRDIRQGLSYIRRSPLLVWMTAAAVLFSVLYYSLYLPFAQAATARYPDPEALAGFFGLFWAAVTAAAFLVSMLLTNRLLGWFGAAAMVLVLPILYAGAFGVLLVSASLTTLVAIRLGVNAWLQGVSSPAWETLINVVPETRRDQVRGFLGGGPTQAGTAIAGIVTLVGQEALTARQLSLIGLAVSVITIVVAWRIRRSYTSALVEALHAGRPSVFEGGAVEGLPIAPDRDAQAMALALEASDDPDPHVRRLAVEMLAASAGDARVGEALVRLAGDADAMVRSSAIVGLGRTRSLDATLRDRALGDEDRSVRLSAVLALRDRSIEPALTSRLRLLAEDADADIAAASMVALLASPARSETYDGLRRLLGNGDPEVRAAAVRQMRHSTEDVVALVDPMLRDDSPTVRTQALRTLASRAPDAAIPHALTSLEADEAALRDAAFNVLAELDLREHVSTLILTARTRGALARRDGELVRAIPAGSEPSELLREALLSRARSNALVALSALALASREHEAMRAALENLRGSEPGQLANALETLETSEHRSIAQPLLSLWESVGDAARHRDDWLEIVSQDPDPLIRGCVDLILSAEERGDDMARSRTSMSPMERVLVLRRIPLFAGLSPADLQNVAAIAEERTYADADVIAGEGELGDELHLVISGTVAVLRGDASDAPVARRGAGDVVGEMSLFTRAPRIASLVAEGDVRTLRIGHREFETMVRERPEVALAVMRVLAERLGAETAER